MADPAIGLNGSPSQGSGIWLRHRPGWGCTNDNPRSFGGGSKSQCLETEILTGGCFLLRKENSFVLLHSGSHLSSSFCQFCGHACCLRLTGRPWKLHYWSVLQAHALASGHDGAGKLPWPPAMRGASLWPCKAISLLRETEAQTDTFALLL